MPFADLVRRSPSQQRLEPKASAASTSYHGSGSNPTARHPPSSMSMDRFTFGRNSKNRSSVAADTGLLQPHTAQTSNRSSHYSTTEAQSIGEAPSHTRSRSAAPSPSPSTANDPSRLSAAPSNSSQINQYDRLFGLSGTSASVSPRQTPLPLANQPPPSASSLPSAQVAASSPVPSTEPPSTRSLTDQATGPTPASASSTLLRSRSTKPRSPFPPASASTGTSATQRDKSIMGSTIFRRPSLRRRRSSRDSTNEIVDKIMSQHAPSSPTTEAETKPKRSDSANSVSVPAHAVASKSTPFPAPAATPAPLQTAPAGRFARLFGRRKSISSPINTAMISKPDLIANPVPALKDASSALNRQSPPLAIISAHADKIAALDLDKHDSVSSKTMPPPSTGGSAKEKPSDLIRSTSKSPEEARTAPEPLTIDSTNSQGSAFTFPARTSTSDDTQKQTMLSDSMPSRQAKHSTSRSLPLASLPVSGPAPLSSSPDPSMTSTGRGGQRPQTQPVESARHRKNSRSLSVIGNIFGSSTSPPLPQSSTPIGQRVASAESQSSHKREASTASHTHRPSLRLRLRIGKGSTDKDPNRPTTPEIESWKRNSDNKQVSAVVARGRSSVDGHSRPPTAESPVKITRSKSAIRRKPAPEVKQDEIDSSSSTPVYSTSFRALDVDFPRGGSLASSPVEQHVALPVVDSNTEHSPKLIASSPAPVAGASMRDKSSQNRSSQVQGLGLSGTHDMHNDGAHTLVPSIDIRPSTPPRDNFPASSEKGASTHERLAPSSSSPLNDKQPASESHSIAPSTTSYDRPYSLISAGEHDTPLLKLRNFVVDTNGSDDDRDGHSIGLFFHPADRESRDVKEAEVTELAAFAPTEELADKSAKKEAAVTNADETEHLRTVSQSTTRSDTKHEISSIYLHDSGTVRPPHSLGAQTSMSGFSAASAGPSDVSASSTIRLHNLPVDLGGVTAEPVFTSPEIEHDHDSVGPLPSKSPAMSQRSLRLRPSPRDSSPWNASGQTTAHQSHRLSTASRMTARSSGHWSESRLSEDALSALEAEVGQARRAEVIALGKGRVKDWVGGAAPVRVLATAEAPTLSRSNTMRKGVQPPGKQAAEVDEREARRQKALNEGVDEKLRQLSDAQGASASGEIRDIPDEDSHEGGEQELQSAAPRFARLSAFHDRKLTSDLDQASPAAATNVISQTMEEAVRLGRAPLKRVRRSVSEAKSAGEAVMVTRKMLSLSARRSSSTHTGTVAARQRRRAASMSAKSTTSQPDATNPTLDASFPTALAMQLKGLSTENEEAAVAGGGEKENAARSKQPLKQRSFATSEEAARARQQELMDRDRRQAEKEAKRQAQLLQKYAKKKQNDPLFAARLALVGLQPGEVASKSASAMTSSGLQVPVVAERRGSGVSPGFLAARNGSFAGSVASFHTALDSPKAMTASLQDKSLDDAAIGAGGETSFSSSSNKDGGRPDTSFSIASSLAVDFEFPIPPQRMKEQLSEDGTLLSRAGLQESPLQQQRRLGEIPTPPRDSSLRDRFSPLQTVALRRAKSVGYNLAHHQQQQERQWGLGLDLNELNAATPTMSRPVKSLVA